MANASATATGASIAGTIAAATGATLATPISMIAANASMIFALSIVYITCHHCRDLVATPLPQLMERPISCPRCESILCELKIARGESITLTERSTSVRGSTIHSCIWGTPPPEHPWVESAPNTPSMRGTSPTYTESFRSSSIHVYRMGLVGMPGHTVADMSDGEPSSASRRVLGYTRSLLSSGAHSHEEARGDDLVEREGTTIATSLTSSSSRTSTTTTTPTTNTHTNTNTTASPADTNASLAAAQGISLRKKALLKVKKLTCLPKRLVNKWKEHKSEETGLTHVWVGGVPPPRTVAREVDPAAYPTAETDNMVPAATAPADAASLAMGADPRGSTTARAHANMFPMPGRTTMASPAAQGESMVSLNVDTDAPPVSSRTGTDEIVSSTIENEITESPATATDSVAPPTIGNEPGVSPMLGNSLMAPHALVPAAHPRLHRAGGGGVQPARGIITANYQEEMINVISRVAAEDAQQARPVPEGLRFYAEFAILNTAAVGGAAADEERTNAEERY